MSWVELDPVGETNPAGRQGHTICSIDGKTKQEMVVFGGAQGGCTAALPGSISQRASMLS